MKFVYLVWIDHHTDDSWVNVPDRKPTEDEYLVDSMAIVTYEDDEWITISAALTRGGKQHQGPITINKKLIQYRKNFTKKGLRIK